MARSRRRRGVKMPGVSMNTSWAWPRMATPKMRMRVVCTFGETMEILAPTRMFSRVDLPTLGAPRMAMKPQRWSVAPGGGAGDEGSIGTC
jgi:hypothetical protein